MAPDLVTGVAPVMAPVDSLAAASVADEEVGPSSGCAAF